MTAVANATFSAQEYNTYIRDNLLATAPALATASGQHFVTTGARALAARSTTAATTTGSNTTTSTTYASITGGPVVTVTTGKSALIWFSATISNSLADTQTSVSVAVSGGTNIPANNNWRIINDGRPANEAIRVMSCHRFAHGAPDGPDLIAGSNTFTMKYRVGGGTGTFLNRHLIVMPL